MTPAAELLELVKAQLPQSVTNGRKAWRFIPNQRSFDTPDTVTLVVKESSIRPHPAAPSARHQTTMTLTLVHPSTDIPTAEDELSVLVRTLIAAFTPINGVAFDTAEKVAVTDQLIGWDVRVDIDTSLTY